MNKNKKNSFKLLLEKKGRERVFSLFLVICTKIYKLLLILNTIGGSEDESSRINDPEPISAGGGRPL